MANAPGNSSVENLASLIDHTLLKPEATRPEVLQLCDEAKQYGFASVVIHPCYVRLAAEQLDGSGVRVCTVVGFPLGANRTTTKVAEAESAIRDGATEIDMVINIGAVKSGLWQCVADDIDAVVTTCRPRASVKVILETALLTDAEKIRACELARAGGAAFVKTSTGFGPGGATINDVRLMRRVVGVEMGVKAAGGIGSQRQAAAMIAAGATRIGASAGIKIVGGT